MFQIYFDFLDRISHLLTVGKQHPGKKSPLSGIAVNKKKPLLYSTNRKSCDHEISIKKVRADRNNPNAIFLWIYYVTII